ncbi:hypothetical protein VTO42DRAFT_3194 [Malbranchea cinnamomea]
MVQPPENPQAKPYPALPLGTTALIDFSTFVSLLFVADPACSLLGTPFRWLLTGREEKGRWQISRPWLQDVPMRPLLFMAGSTILCDFEKCDAAFCLQIRQEYERSLGYFRLLNLALSHQQILLVLTTSTMSSSCVRPHSFSFFFSFFFTCFLFLSFFSPSSCLDFLPMEFLLTSESENQITLFPVRSRALRWLSIETVHDHHQLSALPRKSFTPVSYIAPTQQRPS